MESGSVVPVCPILESGRLKKLVADPSLDQQMPQDVSSRKW